MPTENTYPPSPTPTDSDLQTASSSRRKRRDRGLNISIFKKAKNPRIENSSFIVNNIQAEGDSNAQDPLIKLHGQVATNAILNAGGRADEVRCYPGTREEVIGLIERWMEPDGNDETAPNMLWLSGPAGAGKSAIVQTIAEHCKDNGVLAANFFFFRADPTRRTAQPLVATLLYQIVKSSPTARQAIGTVLSDDPLLFGASIHDQFDQLLLSPLRRIAQSLESCARRPIVLLIDGLDECDSEHKLPQRQILLALDHLLAQNDSPFLVLVASRAEPQISMTFKQLACSMTSIFLDEKYAPEKDIRKFVTGEFHTIKQTHHLAHSLSDSWPSADDIGAIVRKSSGQFIFAATVMRFLSNSAASPMLSLERVQGIAPVAKNSPFAQLDAICTYVLSQVDDQQAVTDLLSAKLLHNVFRQDNDQGLRQMRLPVKKILTTYDPTRYSLALIDSCASELTSILRFRGDELKFYHASFTDFLKDKSRSGEYHVDIHEFNAKILPAIWMKAPESMACALTGLELIAKLERPTPDITKMLWTMSPASTRHPDLFLDYSLNDAVFRSIHRLYYRHDIKSCNKIMRQWVSWYVSRPESGDLSSLSRLPRARTYVWMSKMEYWYTSTLRPVFRRK